MTLQYLGFDLTINEFVDNYLIKKPVEYGADGTLYGPDLDAAFAGDIYSIQKYEGQLVYYSDYFAIKNLCI